MAKIENFYNPDWATYRVHFQRKNGNVESRLEIVNKKTNLRYHYEHSSETACKAGVLATMGIPAYSIANLAMQVVRAVTVVFSVVLKSFIDLLTAFSLNTVKNFFVNLTFKVPLAILKSIWAIVKTPLCALAMEFCAICAIFKPITWRVHLAKVESFWRGTDRKHHLFEDGTAKGHEVGNRISNFFSDPDSKYGFFLAYCFQPWGSMNDPHVLKDLCVELTPNSSVG